MAQRRLSAAQLAEVTKLGARDREVRLHEAQHQAAAGALAIGGPQFTYQPGPDGKLYAIGGELKLNTGAGQTPEETIDRAAQIRAAALAPADPSGQDLEVASEAADMETQAQEAIVQKNQTEAHTSRAAQLAPGVSYA